MKIIGTIATFTICFTLIHFANTLAVMSVDLGSEWMKVGVVSPGVPMEIALNKESKRKTPAVISFKDNERLFGEDAQTLGIRFPKNAYMYLLDLLGKDINHPMVKLYQKRFPYYEIVENPERKTIMFKHDEDNIYSVEELLAQLLVKAKEFAEQAAHQPIKECVITVPGYFNQVERVALGEAVKLANLKLLQLINDYTAVALNYGIFRSKDFNDTTQYVMFYDMGASSTTATIVSFQNTKTKERGYMETHPELNIIGVGYDRTLGGLEMQLRLRDYLGNKFNEVKKTKNDVFGNNRSMAKLFKEAGRLKNVLSANIQHIAQIEGLLDEEDFKLPVTRQEFEDLIPDLLERVGLPVEKALKSAQLTKDVLNQVVLFGAGTRVPRVQEILREIVGQDLAKNLNTDEAAAMGAVYKAADLSTGFQVKKFITKDAVLFPIQVNFERETDSHLKQVKRTLFSLMNPYPQKKIITFNKYTDDFTFNVNYAELGYLNTEEVNNIGILNLTEVSLTGVRAAIEKHPLSENVESKGIKAHFQMDESGILHLINVELVVEKKIIEEDDEGTFSKLGSTISKLFGGEEKVEEKPDEKPNSPKVPQDPTNETQNQEEKKETIEEKIASNSSNSKNNTVKAKPQKPKIVTLKEPITVNIKSLNLMPLNEDQFLQSQKKLEKLNNIEKEVLRRSTALNNLETFVVDVQNKLLEDEYSEAVTAEDKEKILNLFSSISDWLYEDGADVDAATYEKKLESLRTETNPLFARVWEHRERPEALAALNSMLNHSTHFLESAKNLTDTVNPTKNVFTDKEVESLEKIISDTDEWLSKNVAVQEKLKKYEDVVLTVKSITEKMGLLDREVKYLVNKLRLWKPKKEEKVGKKDEKKSEDTINNATEGESRSEINETESVENERKSGNTEPNKEKSEPPHNEL
ncbi:hypoxia up-regulated protein 1 [Coccinella septempunctata]|uniref:hypoxia up-regulated protein 1 n=1 Tax=Coccinella septempunctata TaxID=41139 RepID=UPI001D06C990|nr:hypoxia up-regulated protein 1 [Coccinella septempunctata]